VHHNNIQAKIPEDNYEKLKQHEHLQILRFLYQENRDRQMVFGGGSCGFRHKVVLG